MLPKRRAKISSVNDVAEARHAARPSFVQRIERTDPLGALFRFGISGGLSTFLYVFLAAGLQWLMPEQPLQTHLVAYAVGLAFSYVVHCRFTFRYSGPHRRALLRFAATAAFAFTLSTVAVEWMAVHLGFDGFPVILGATAIIVATNFLSMFFWVFVTR